MSRPKQSEAFQPSQLPDTFEALLDELAEARDRVRDVLARISELAHVEILAQPSVRPGPWMPPKPTGIGTSPVAKSLGGGKGGGGPFEPLPPPPKRSRHSVGHSVPADGSAARMDAAACTDATLEFIRNSDVPATFANLSSHGIDLGHSLRQVRAAVKTLVLSGKVRTVGAGKAVRYEQVKP